MWSGGGGVWGGRVDLLRWACDRPFSRAGVGAAPCPSSPGGRYEPRNAPVLVKNSLRDRPDPRNPHEGLRPLAAVPEHP